MTDSKIDFGDPFELWLKEASFYIDKLRLKVCPPAEALSLVVNAFGKEWILSQINNAKEKHALESRHRLVSMIMIAGKKEVFEVYELANYIQELYQKPRFDQVISMMKVENQYLTAFNQLAFGYRFHKIGVTDLEFEPPTDGGKNSDLIFQYKGVFFIVESFVPQSNKGIPYENVLKISTKRANEIATTLGKKITTFVTIKDIDQWDDSKRKGLEVDIEVLIRNVDKNKLEINKVNYHIEVYDTGHIGEDEELALFNSLESRATAGMNFGLMEKEKLSNVRRGEGAESKLTGRFMLEAISTSKATIEELVETLASKLEKKIRQTRKESVNAKGILLVGRPYLGNEEDKRKVNYQKVRSKVINKHENIQAVLLVSHTHGSDALPFFTGEFLDKEDCLECESLLNELITLEWQKDFLLS